MDFTGIAWALVWFTVLGIMFGAMLAAASKLFAVKVDKRIEEINDALPGANCGGCGYAGCAALAAAISRGEEPVSACTAGSVDTAKQIAAIMDVPAVAPARMRAQVMCLGTSDKAKQKYKYEGPADCDAVMRLAGGTKMCPFGCLGFGTCVSVCKFDAIKIVNGIAFVDYKNCTGCGVCVNSCPKGVIKLIPYESDHWVSCISNDNPKTTRSYCDAGCIGCRICEKACEFDAIHVNGYIAEIDYSKCVSCGKCVIKCPRKIISYSSTSQKVKVEI